LLPSGAALVLSLLPGLPARAQLVDAARALDLNDFNATVGSGARAWGMGGAFLAVADDATAATWNPAGLAILQQPEATLVYVPIDDASFDYVGFTTAQAGDLDGVYTGFALELEGDYLDYASFAYPLVRERLNWVPQLSYQRAINRDFTLTQRSPSFFAQSDPSGLVEQQLLDRTQRSEGGYDVLAASLAVGLSEKLAVGVSLNFWDVDVESTVVEQINGSIDGFPPEERTIRRELDQQGDAFNANLGVMWRPITKLAVGAVYKTPFDLDLDVTDVTVESIMSSGGSVEATLDQSGSGTIEWPETIAVGVAGRPIERLLLSTDWTETRWSDARIKGNRAGQPIDEPFPGGADVERQEDARQLRFGMEYSLVGKEFVVPFRFGIFTDRQILRDDAGETVEVTGLSMGTGVAAGNWIFDLALVRTETDGFRTSAFDSPAVAITPRGNGELESESTRAYLSGIYRFGSKK
jgi:long-subunit fatty acid transport protein